jgi:hypothetical protein
MGTTIRHRGERELASSLHNRAQVRNRFVAIDDIVAYVQSQVFFAPTLKCCYSYNVSRKMHCPSNSSYRHPLSKGLYRRIDWWPCVLTTHAPNRANPHPQASQL